MPNSKAHKESNANVPNSLKIRIKGKGSTFVDTCAGTETE